VQALEEDAAACQRKMDSATALLHALSGEEGRWTSQSKEFDSQIMRLTGEIQLLQLPLLSRSLSTTPHRHGSTYNAAQSMLPAAGYTLVSTVRACH
jgi:hypothetical protein